MAKSYRTPRCGRCGNAHYNFQACPPRQDVKPEVEWRTGDTWGNQMRDLKVLGDNTFVQRREYDK